MQDFSPERSSHAETVIVVLVTLAALVALGFVLAFWTWVWFAPRPEPRTEAAAEPGRRLESTYSLFGGAQRDRSAAAPTGAAIRLLGVVAASGKRRGHAVVQLDSKQIVVAREGEDVAPGIRLAEVHPGHVILEHNGAREMLAWPKKTPAPESSATRSQK